MKYSAELRYLMGSKFTNTAGYPVCHGMNCLPINYGWLYPELSIHYLLSVRNLCPSLLPQGCDTFSTRQAPWMCQRNPCHKNDLTEEKIIFLQMDGGGTGTSAFVSPVWKCHMPIPLYSLLVCAAGTQKANKSRMLNGDQWYRIYHTTKGNWGDSVQA